MSQRIVQEFEYRLNPVPLALTSVLACAGTGMFVYFAIYPLPGPVDFKGIPLSPNQFRVVMGVSAAFSIFGLCMAAMGLVSSLVDRRRIALTDDAIILPKPDWWGVAARSEVMEVRYEDIARAEVLPFVGKALQLRITHRGGTVRIPSNMLPSRRDFTLLSEQLCAVSEPLY